MSIEKLGKVDFENSEIELVFSMMLIIFNLNVNETIYMNRVVPSKAKYGFNAWAGRI